MSHTQPRRTGLSARIACCLTCLFLLPAAAALAQETGGRETYRGALTGRVVDRRTQAPLSQVVVAVVDLQREALTGKDGTFTMAEVPVGTYTMRFVCAGYRELVRPDVIVRPARFTTVNADLAASLRREEEVSVRAAYFAEAGQTGGSSIALAEEEIRRAPGSANDVSRALFTLPGIARADDDSNELIVRGGSPAENGFYLDGMYMPNINHFPQEGASGGSIGILNTDLIEEVTVHTGGFDASFGNRLSAIVDIRYREGNRREVDGQIDLNVAGFGGGIEGPLPRGKGSWIVTGRRSYLDFLSDKLGIVGLPRYGDAQAKLVVDLTPKHRISALDVFGDSRFTRDRDQAIEDDNSEGWEHHEMNATGLGWRALWTRRFFSETTVSYAYMKSRKSWHDPDEPATLLPDDFFDGGLHLRNVNSLRLSQRIEASFGLEARRREGHAFDGSTEETVRVEGVERAAFANVTIRPFRWLTLTGGARADHVPYTGRNHLSPRASALVNLGDRLELHAAYGLYRQNTPLHLLEQDELNHDLDDPSATHWLAGMSWTLAPHSRLTLDAYDKEYDRMPMSPEDPLHFPLDDVTGQRDEFRHYGLLVDAGRARARGLEATFQRKMSGGVYGIVSATYGRSQYRDLEGGWRNRVHDNRYVLNLVMGYRPSYAWELSAQWVVAGGRADTAIDPVLSAQAGYTVRDQAHAMEDHLPSYHSLNLRCDRRFRLGRRSLVVFLNLWNVYARGNVRARYWSSSQETIREEHQWPFLPLFGVELEF